MGFARAVIEFIDIDGRGIPGRDWITLDGSGEGVTLEVVSLDRPYGAAPAIRIRREVEDPALAESLQFEGSSVLTDEAVILDPKVTFVHPLVRVVGYMEGEELPWRDRRTPDGGDRYEPFRMFSGPLHRVEVALSFS